MEDLFEMKSIPGFSNYTINKLGVLHSLITDREIKGSLDRDGYQKTNIYSDEGVTKRMFVHRLVLLTFIGPSKLACDHIDENKLNNTLSNLRYLDNRENVRRSKRNKLGVSNIKKVGKKFGVQFCIKGKVTYFGTYETLEEASNKANEVRITL